MTAPDRVGAAALSVGAVLGATVAGSRFNPSDIRTGIWYKSLRKPRYTPKGPVYGIVWTILGGFLAFAGYRLLTRRERSRALPIGFWAATVSGLAAFPALFFGARSASGGTVASAAMCGASAVTAATAYRVDAAASIAMVPLTLWTAFATLLSEEIVRRN